MTLAAGIRLGPYEVLASLGRGGMGEVYRARDTRIGREVAIKVLPSLARDEDRLKRFEREARAAGSLNHPNLLALHDVGTHEGMPYIVSELLEGSTMRALLSSSALPVRKALDYAVQMARGLGAAHERGILHRDLKPENVFVTQEGRVKILDFGLAKLMRPEETEQADSALGTQTQTTQPGVVLGTVGYMSPEQVRGQPADQRSDIFAFGAVVYEMLSGRQAFRGTTGVETLNAILKEDPPEFTASAPIPPALKRIVLRCLEKDPAQRFRSAHDVAFALEEAQAGGTTSTSETAVAPARARRSLLAGGLAGLVLGSSAVAGLAWSSWRAAKAAPDVVRFAITLPADESCPFSFNQRVALSPDSRNLAYACLRKGIPTLFLRPLDRLQTRVLYESGGGGPFFSRDGQWLGFIVPRAGTLNKVPLMGGAPVTVATWESLAGATWAPDGSLYYVPRMPGGIARLQAGTGEPQEVARPDGNERAYRFPYVLPTGKVLLYTAAMADSESYDDARVVAQSLETGTKKVLVEGGTYPLYSPTGHLLYARGGTLFAAPFDSRRLALSGRPVPVLEGVAMSLVSGQAYYNVSEKGDLVYIPGPVEGGQRTLAWVDRQGKEELLPLPPRSYLHPRLSPDGRQLAIEIEGANHDCYLYDLSRDVLTKMTLDGVSHWPLWTPDGRRLTYRSGRMGAFAMWWVPADRSAGPEELGSKPKGAGSESAVSWTPDGRNVAFINMDRETGADVHVLPVEGDRKPQPVAHSKFAEGSPKFSPDGRWLAYCSNESGRPEVHVQPYPGPGPKIQVSSEGGTDPLWRRQGGELYYRNGDQMMVVSVRTQPTFAASRPGLLWKGHYSHGMSSSCGPPGPTSSNYDVTPDGARFLMVKDPHQDVALRQIVVVLGWAGELRQKLADEQRP